MAAEICGDPEKAFMSSLVRMCLCLYWVCQIIQTPGWHGWVRELAYNEGDVPQLLPVSDASLNQEWREVDIASKKVTVVVKADMCDCLSWYINESKSLVWYIFYHNQKVYNILSCRRTLCLFHQWLWLPCVDLMFAFTDPLPLRCSSSYNLNERICI